MAIEVPGEAYEAYGRGEISRDELEELEKFAEALNGKVAAAAKTTAGLFSDPGRAMKVLGGMALAAPTLAYVGSKVPQGLQGAMSAATFDRDFNKVLKVNPQLGGADDPNLRMAYKTLRTLNPGYSKDPLVAGTILDNVMQNRMDPNDPSSPPRYEVSLANELARASASTAEGKALSDAQTRGAGALSGALKGSVGLVDSDYLNK